MALVRAYRRRGHYGRGSQVDGGYFAPFDCVLMAANWAPLSGKHMDVVIGIHGPFSAILRRVFTRPLKFLR